MVTTRAGQEAYGSGKSDKPRRALRLKRKREDYNEQKDETEIEDSDGDGVEEQEVANDSRSRPYNTRSTGGRKGRKVILDDDEEEHPNTNGGGRRYALRSRGKAGESGEEEENEDEGGQTLSSKSESEGEGEEEEEAQQQRREYDLRKRVSAVPAPRTEAQPRSRKRLKLHRHAREDRHRRSRMRGQPWRPHAGSDDDVLEEDPGQAWRTLMQPGPMWAGGQAGAVPGWPAPGGTLPPHTTPQGPGLHGVDSPAPYLMPGGAPASAAAHRMRQPWEPAMNPADALRLATGPGDRNNSSEITAVQVDPGVSFDQVGGLEQYIQALQEMVFLPLVYPELFQRFRIQPPRGVLFYGPPGTGKTLVARALASHASRFGRRVTFFMRKGADVLSKWVGESERQLRLLFEEAQRQQPAIIFFDEIDGLAPVRSSRQDQIHNSIVSTLLALLDGLEGRGQVVVIGATNRLDSIDPALRRPGRFDRELLFPLPNLTARRSILNIHTRSWAEAPTESLQEELAAMCVGYCGADLKALCTEAALQALRRRYPQIYESHDKLAVEPGAVRVERQDFLRAFAALTPASHRSAATHARPLSSVVAPCLKEALEGVLGGLRRNFPPVEACLAPPDDATDEPGSRLHGPSSSGQLVGRGAAWMAQQLLMQLESGGADALGGSSSTLSLLFRPRLLICGAPGSGQAHLAAALLHALEGLPVHAVGLPALLANPSARCPEEALVHAFVEAQRAAPAVLYLPQLQLWWQSAAPLLRAVLLALLQEMPPDLPLLLLATADCPLSDLDEDVGSSLFMEGQVAQLDLPTAAQRTAFFQDILTSAASPGPSQHAAAAATPRPPPLPRAPEAIAAEDEAAAAEAEAAARLSYEAEQAALRQLRMQLRSVTGNLIKDRRFKIFVEPMSPDDDLEIYEEIGPPMSLANILANNDDRAYSTLAQYLADVRLVREQTAAYYNEEPHCIEVRRAAELVDSAEEMVALAVPARLATECEAIAARGGPIAPPPGLAASLQAASDAVRSTVNGHAGVAGGSGRLAGGLRVSRRLRGQQAEPRLLHEDPNVIKRNLRNGARSTGGRDAASVPGSEMGSDAEQPQVAVEMDADVVHMADVEQEHPNSSEAALPGSSTHSMPPPEPSSMPPPGLHRPETAHPGTSEAGPSSRAAEQPPVLAPSDPAEPHPNGVQDQRLEMSFPPRKRGKLSAQRHTAAAESAAAAAGEHPNGRTTAAAPDQQYGTLAAAGAAALSAALGRDALTPLQSALAAAMYPPPASQPLPPATSTAAAAASTSSAPATAEPGTAHPPEVARAAARAEDVEAASVLLGRLSDATAGYELQRLEALHARLAALLRQHHHNPHRLQVLASCEAVVAAVEQQREAMMQEG